MYYQYYYYIQILYEQPDIGHIYLLIQPRDNATAEQRLETLLESPVFDRLRAKHDLHLLKQMICALQN